MEFFVNGSFASVDFPALASVVNRELFIQTTNPSFKCPSNIVPKIVTFPNCVYSQDYVDTPDNKACPAQSQPTGNTPSITTPSSTNNAGTTTHRCRKTSEASDFNRAGYQLYQLG
jgi:hypothetical protein